MLHNTTTLTTAVGTLVIPGPHTRVLTIQNTGTVNVYLSLDGGSTYMDPYAQKAGVDPTTTVGYLLAVGAQFQISYTSASELRPIRGIAASGTANLQIATDDTGSTFPTT